MGDCADHRGREGVGGRPALKDEGQQVFRPQLAVYIGAQ